MWSNSPLVLLSVRLGERFRLRLPLGLWAVSGLLLSLDGLLAWVPGTWGGRLRPLSDGTYAFLRELAACWLSLLLVGLLLEQSLGGLLGGGALLFLWRLLPRPVLLALLLPVNLPLAGLFTPVVDGLLVAWACAWTGVSLGLWGCLAAALALGIARLPLARWKWARGMPPALLPR